MNVMEAAPARTAKRGTTGGRQDGGAALPRERVRRPEAARRMEIVAALWFASWLLLGAAHTADLQATALGALVFGWLGLPLVVAGTVRLAPDAWLARKSVIWAAVQTALWIVVFSTVRPQMMPVTELFRNALALTALVLLPAWVLVSIRANRRRRGARRRPLSRSALPLLALAAALGLLIGLIGNALWSDEIHVFAALSASVSACLGFTWWIVNRCEPDRRTWLAGGFLLLAAIALDVALDGLGPFGFACQSVFYFGLVAWLAAAGRTRSDASQRELASSSACVSLMV